MCARITSQKQAPVVSTDMPVYRITHSLCISPEQKQRLATEIKNIHCDNTGAPAKYVQTIFQQLGSDDAYTAEEKNEEFVCLEGVIRPGRSQEVESKIVWQLNDMLKVVLSTDKYFISLGRFTSPHLIENGNLLPVT